MLQLTPMSGIPDETFFGNVADFPTGPHFKRGAKLSVFFHNLFSIAPMPSDLTFIANEAGKHLRERFSVLLGEGTRHFDCLVGYFISGLHRLHSALTQTVKTRILAGKAGDASADASASEREIDELVYALYGLTPEEIQIVESASAAASARQGGAAR